VFDEFIKQKTQRDIRDKIAIGQNAQAIGFGQEINRPGIPIGDLLKRIEKLEHNLKNIETILNNLLEAKNE
jgi:ribosomal protein S3